MKPRDRRWDFFEPDGTARAISSSRPNASGSHAVYAPILIRGNWNAMERQMEQDDLDGRGQFSLETKGLRNWNAMERDFQKTTINFCEHQIPK